MPFIAANNYQLVKGGDASHEGTSEHVGYIRPVTNDQGTVEYGLFAADGSEIALFHTHGAAQVVARQHDLLTLNTH